jgi:16S rRNA (guanine966-N2)-methyltransferase
VSRIIAGRVGSLRLGTAANVTRPTSDRVKESLFSSLESLDVLSGARVLDLFAGTAALGLEAISRGAASLVAVEKSKAAALVCKKNIELVQSALAKQQVQAEVQLITKDAESFLKTNMTNQKLTEVSQLLARSLAKDALVVVERSSRHEMHELLGLELQSQKSYGDTSVYFFRVSAQ